MDNALNSQYLKNVTEHADDPFVLSPTGNRTFADLRDEVERMSCAFRGLEMRRVGIVVRPDRITTSIAAMIVLGKSNADVFLLGPDQSESQRASWAGELRLAAVVDFAEAVSINPGSASSGSLDGNGAIVILTSGTTGKPKAARHTWTTLMRPARVKTELAKTRWLCSYPLHLYAGLQVFTQCFTNASAFCGVSASRDPGETASIIDACRIDHACGTPSFWRHLLFFGGEKLEGITSIRQITMGGEVATQDVLDRLKKTFPRTRIVHIYATTELGRCFSVTDGMAGFPSRFLDETSPDGISLKVADGELFVRSQNAMVSYDMHSSARSDAGDWFATGDLVELSGERVCFVGRRSDVINVGGHKVFPLEVEQVIRGLPFVRDVRVYGMRSSIMGELVACDVVFAELGDPGESRRALIRACADSLNEHQRPRRINTCENIGMSVGGKTVRGKTQ